jgi:hypothetical protein
MRVMSPRILLAVPFKNISQYCSVEKINKRIQTYSSESRQIPSDKHACSIYLIFDMTYANGNVCINNDMSILV